MRCYVEEFIPPKSARFACPAGHKFIRTIFGHRGAHKRGLGETAARMMARYWRKENNGVSMDCPICKAAHAEKGKGQ